MLFLMNETSGSEMQLLQRLLEQDLADLVVGDDVGQREAFRRAVFDVAHVEIEPAAVEEKAAVARRLVVIAVVQIDQAELLLLEDVIADARRDGGQPERFGSHAAIFGLQAGEPLHALTVPRFWREATGNIISRRVALRPSNK